MHKMLLLFTFHHGIGGKNIYSGDFALPDFTFNHADIMVYDAEYLSAFTRFLDIVVSVAIILPSTWRIDRLVLHHK